MGGDDDMEQLDIRLKLSLRYDKKIRALARALNAWLGIRLAGGTDSEASLLHPFPIEAARFMAIGLVADILLLAAQREATRRQGAFHNYDAQDFADALSWPFNAEALVEILIDTEWMVRDADDTLCVHGWLDHQEFLTQYDDFRDTKREAGRKGGVASGRSRQSGKKEHGQGVKPRSKTEANPKQTEPRDHTLQDSDQTPSKNAARRRAAYAREFELTWEVYPRKQGKAAAFDRWLTYSIEDQRGIYRAATYLAHHVRMTGANRKYIPHGSTFLQPNPKEKSNWEDWRDGCPECEGECSPLQRNSDNVLDRMRAGARNIRRLTEGNDDEETRRGGPSGLSVLALPPGGSGGDDD